jgi:hypothetical protein
MVDYDTVAVNENAKNLHQYMLAADIGAVINKIIQYKMIGDYDEAVSLIDTILED